MFRAMGNKGFQISFANGNTVSVQWGPSNYCEPTDERGRNAPFDAPMGVDDWGRKALRLLHGTVMENGTTVVATKLRAG